MTSLPTTSEAATPSRLVASPGIAREAGDTHVAPLGEARPTGRDEHAPTPRVEQREPEADHPSLRVVVALACQSVERCELASGMLVRDGDAAVIEASEPLATDLDRLQRELDEGPGPQACRTASIVTSDDLGTDARWPSFSSHAHRAGIAAVVAIPLIPEREFPGWCGWLILYSRRPGPFSPAAIALAQTLARYCSNTVTGGLHAKNFEAALASRDLIGQAKGILMARKRINDDQAFAILQRASQHANRRLRDVAETVVRSCGHQGIDE